MPSERSTPVSRRAYGATSGPHRPVPQPASSTSSCFAALEAGRRERGRHERGRAVGQPLELGLEAGREAVERPLDERVRRARRHLAAGARRPHVARDRIVGLVLEPLLEDLHRLVGLAERAVREREQPPRVPVLRPQRDRPCRSTPPLPRVRFKPVEQDAEVRVRVDVAGIDRDRRAVRRFGAGGLADGSQHRRRDCCGRWRAPARSRSRAGRRRSPGRIAPVD